ncbi:MAG: GDP-mannose 4,6-dehydratase [Gammaproteobacteria bacterium]|nr:GDP-mannose 4,6-dehydratase [Gammaproteobacteria bacterium]
MVIEPKDNPRLILLVTGGLGFIGKHFVNRVLNEGHYVINVDCMNYAADCVSNKEFARFDNYHFLREDIVSLPYLPECDYLINFAAESHVDNSISSAEMFCRSNVLGVQRLLDLTIKKLEQDRPVFIQMSTDEVYGDIEQGLHTDQDALLPSNPYSATKASADLLIKSYERTYGVQFNIIRPTNNYGPHQFPEKLIPKSTLRMKRGLPALLHGDGSYIRSWLHVEDTVDGIMTVINKGNRNEIYNMCGDLELKNIEVVAKIAAILNVDVDEYCIPVKNRAGQDVRYSVDDSKLRSLGWRPTRNFDEEFRKIVETQEYSRFLNDSGALGSA